MAAAKAVSAATGVEIATFVIGPDRDATDMYGEWPNLRDTEESGCLLVRPDHSIRKIAAAGFAGALFCWDVETDFLLTKAA